MLARGAAEIKDAPRHGEGRGGAEADLHAGQWGLVVEVVDRSRCAPETRAWDLGNGATSDEAHLIHRDDHAGAYTVTLTVTNDCGSSTGSRALNVLAERRVAGRFGPQGACTARSPDRRLTSLPIPILLPAASRPAPDTRMRGRAPRAAGLGRRDAGYGSSRSRP